MTSRNMATAQAESDRPLTPVSPSPDTLHRPLPALPASSLPLATRQPTKSSRATAVATALKTSLEPVMEGDGRLMRDVHSPPPGDVRRLGRKVSGPELSKQRSQYFEDAFRSRHAGEKRDDVSSVSSLILAEVKTNVFIADEFSFITDLASHLSTRYNHPATHIAISLQHGTCLHLGGTFDPAYTVAVNASPSLLQPATNRRNVALLQGHLEEALRVGPARGIVRFIQVPEECSGWRGNTIAGAKEREREKGREREKEREESGGKDGEESPAQKRRVMRSLSIKRPPASDAMTPRRAALQREDTLATNPGGRVDISGNGDEGQVWRGLRKKKSFIHSLFAKTQRSDM